MALILVIDDNPQLRAAMTHMLTGAGHEVRAAADGSQAMALHQAEPSDLVITDILMPKKDGIEIIRELRRDNSKVRIIAISGGGNRGYLNFAGTFGANAVLPKPFRAAELIALVDRLLSEPG